MKDNLHLFTPQEILNIPISGKWVPLFKDTIGATGDTSSYNIDVSDYHQIAVTNSRATGIHILFADTAFNLNGFHEMYIGSVGTRTFEVPQLGSTIYLTLRYTSSTSETTLWVVGI